MIKRPLLAIVLVMMFSSYGYCDKNSVGDIWNKFNNNNKSMWVNGVLEGIVIGHSLSSVKDNKCNKLIKEHFKTQHDILYAKVPVQNIVFGIDLFYSDPANRKIPLRVVFHLVCLKFAGVDEKTIKEWMKGIHIPGAE